MNIFLDDERVPTDVFWIRIPNTDWTIVRNFDQFILALQSCSEAPTYVSFDHDLADNHYSDDFSGEKTGYECAIALVEFCVYNGWPLPSCTIHSLNPIGRKRIQAALNDYEKLKALHAR